MSHSLKFLGGVLAAFVLALGACTSAAPATNPQATAPSQVTATSAPAASGQAVKFNIVSEQSEARYLVKEQLVQVTLPGDAIGKTNKVAGSLALAADGKVVKEQSTFEVDLTGLASDRTQRDNFLRTNTLQTGQFPKATFVATEIKGLSGALPTSGERTFQLVGDLTVKGVTTPVTWDVTATFGASDVTIKAKTSTTFADIKLNKPSVPLVASVEDTIRLELDAKLVKA